MRRTAGPRLCEPQQPPPAQAACCLSKTLRPGPACCGTQSRAPTSCAGPRLCEPQQPAQAKAAFDLAETFCPNQAAAGHSPALPPVAPDRGSASRSNQRRQRQPSIWRRPSARIRLLRDTVSRSHQLRRTAALRAAATSAGKGSLRFGGDLLPESGCCGTQSRAPGVRAPPGCDPAT
jgi:hypothetical protein